MKIDEDFKDLRDDEYLYILNKIYAQMRHLLYTRLTQLLKLQKKTKKRLRYVSTNLGLSRDGIESPSE